MNIDFTALTLGQIVATLLSLAALRFIVGVGKALVTTAVLWTYLADWVTTSALPVVVLSVMAAAGKGIPALNLPPDQLVWGIFLLGAAAYVATTLAGIAANLGLPLNKLPFASALPEAHVAQAAAPAPTTLPPPAP